MKTSHKLIAAAMLSSVVVNANALTILDGWQLDATSAGIASTTTNIGHLNLSGGVGHVTQEVGLDGNPFVGAAFSEFGEIFTISVTKENGLGETDTGFPVNFVSPLQGLRLVFSGLAGTITNVNPLTGVQYAFTAGVGNITFEGSTNGTTFTSFADFIPVSPSGGSLGAFFGGLQGNGNTSLLSLVDSGAIANLFRDSLGNSLDAQIAAGTLFADIQTQNTLSTSGGPNPTAAYSCAFTTGLCKDLTVNSDGSLNLATVPEPSTLALLGLGFLGFAGIRKGQKYSYTA